MRDLTQEEIDQAPNDATHYLIDKNIVAYESDNQAAYFENGVLQDVIPFGPISANAKIIPRNNFDIFKFKFNGEVKVDFANELRVTLAEFGRSVDLGRAETIALAKHFKLTMDDLNNEKK